MEQSNIELRAVHSVLLFLNDWVSILDPAAFPRERLVRRGDMILPSNGAIQHARAVSIEAYQYTGSSALIAGPTNLSNISDVINSTIRAQHGRAIIHALGFHRHSKNEAMPAKANGTRISPSGGSLSITSKIIILLLGYPILPQKLPHFRRSDRNVYMSHPEMPERVHHRIDDGRGRTDGRRLSDALRPERVVR
jgi:hypothetical protein